MPAPSPIAEGAISRPLPARRWHWPPYPFTCVVSGCVFLAALIANYPAVEAPHVVFDQGTLGSDFSIGRHYVHGWPARYARRDRWQPVPTASARGSWLIGPASVWQPWRGVQEFHAISLFADLAFWVVAVILAATGAQYWRSRRRALWQLKMIDLMALVTVAGIISAWIAAERLEERRERAAIAQAWVDRGTSADSYIQTNVAVPAFLPETQQRQYRRLRGRVMFFNSSGQSDLARQFSRLIVLRESYPAPDFGEHLAQMPQLEAIDLSMARLRYEDATRQTTILHDLPPMPNLRGINLAATTVTDADLAWLARCGGLQIVHLSGTKIGDEGVRHLIDLPRLRTLNIWGGPLTDESCRRLAQCPAIEELTISSPNIHDPGVRALGQLQSLRVLTLNVGASDEAFVDLRKALPKCEIRGHP